MGQYQTLMERINQEKKVLFEQVINHVITVEEFQTQCQELEKEFEIKYFCLMADRKMLLRSDEIWIDMGMQPNFS